MNPTVERAVLFAIPVMAIFVCAVRATARRRTLYATCWLAGATCLGMVVLTHIAEGAHWFAPMRWGQPDSVGHYLDLTAALAGGLLLVVGTIARLTHRP